jgi:hypothetical protein
MIQLPLQVKVPLKQVRWQLRRTQAGLRWGNAELQRMPVVIANSMPKSGSHLIIQILEGLPQIGPFVNPGVPPLNRNERNDKQPDDVIIQKLHRLKPGDFTYCYLPAKEPFVSELLNPRIAPIFVSRDPRDTIISHVFYATELNPKHQLRPYYRDVLKTMEERIDATIHGINDGEYRLGNVAVKYRAYLPWFEHPEVLCLRFEDLVLDRNASIARILDLLAAHGFTPRVSRDEAIQKLAGSIQPKRSGTFRKGQPGNWREHFTAANIRHFKEKTGDLLIQMGYEKNRDWK